MEQRNDQSDRRNPYFQIGKPQCGVLCGLIGIAAAFMLLFAGFWRTLFVVLLFAAGYWFGSSNKKMATIKTLLNKLFPPKGE